MALEEIETNPNQRNVILDRKSARDLSVIEVHSNRDGDQFNIKIHFCQ